MSLLARLGVSIPVIQAPMAGVSTPEMAAAVSNAGGLGSVAVGAVHAVGAAKMIDAVRALTDRPFNVNVFVHETPQPDPSLEADWLDALSPVFETYGAVAPSGLATIYESFAEDDEMLAMLVRAAPPVVSFHFGLPDAGKIARLKATGCVLLATATSLAEAQTAEAAGIDAVVAQGWEAGGHRGMFDPQAVDDRLGTLALTRLLVNQTGLPVIAAGGIMDGQGVSAVLKLGAVAAQLGTAFIDCPESAANVAYREALRSDANKHTVMTRVISGRPARCLQNRFTDWGEENALPVPAYPRAYDAGKALNAAGIKAGEHGFGAQWVGQGAPLSRSLPAAELLFGLAREIRETA